MTKIYNSRGEEVGDFNPTTKEYFTIRNAKKSEIFIIPAYLGRVALDIKIIKQLIQLGCEKIDFLIINYKPKSFHAKISMIEFLNNSEEIHYDKKIEHLSVNTLYSPQRRLNCAIDKYEVKNES